MKAVVLERPCSAEELSVCDVPMPQARPGWVVVKIKAFGINRSEIFTRQGDSPSVKLPRILGIECAGEVEDPSDSKFVKGQRVISMMGGLGREFDGSYAEYTLIPSTQIYPVKGDLDFTKLAAIPEMYYTAYASLFEVLRLTTKDTLLIRGGTSSVGICALGLAKSIGATVIATTRKIEAIAFLKSQGADYVILEDEQLVGKLFSYFPNGVTKVLELVGTTTLRSSLKLLAKQGILCMAGILGGQWELEHFEPMKDIQSGTYFTQFDSQIIREDIIKEMFRHIEKYDIMIPIAKTFSLDEISQAHQFMESNQSNGKIVIINEA